MNCPICYDILDVDDIKNKIMTTSCNHKFHEKCIKMWFKESNTNNTFLCPYCRTSMNEITIEYKNNFKNLVYKSKHLKRKTCIINGKPVSFIIKQLQDQPPKAWITHTDYMRPLYKLNIGIESIYITSFLRSYLLLSNPQNNIVLIEKKDFLDEKYYDLEDTQIIAGIFTNNMFYVSYDWCYEVLHFFKQKYGIFYGLIYNTLLTDLALNTMIIMNLENDKSIFQGIYACSMFSILNKLKYLNDDKIVLPEIDLFIFYTDNLYTKEQLQPIIDHQKNYLDNNIILK